VRRDIAIAGKSPLRASQRSDLAHDLLIKSRFCRRSGARDGNLKGFCVSRYGALRVFVTQLGFYLGQSTSVFGRIGLWARSAKLSANRHQMGVEIGSTFAVFGRHTNGFAQPGYTPRITPASAALALGLIGSKNDIADFTQDVGEDADRTAVTPDAASIMNRQTFCHIDSAFGQNGACAPASCRR